MSETVVPIVEETFDAGIFAQKLETVEPGVAVRPDGCAWAMTGRTRSYAAQLPAASSMPADRRARVLRPIEIVWAVCDGTVLEVLVISAPWLRPIESAFGSLELMNRVQIIVGCLPVSRVRIMVQPSCTPHVSSSSRSDDRIRRSNDCRLRETVWSAGASLRKLARVAVAVGAAVEPQLRGGAGHE